MKAIVVMHEAAGMHWMSWWSGPNPARSEKPTSLFRFMRRQIVLMQLRWPSTWT